jgi:dihydrofolate reductase
MEQEIVMIAAMGTNRVLGKDNQLLWHIAEDLQHFKALTTGFPVVMGRKTFEAIGKPLPNRRNIVISRSKADFGVRVEVLNSLEQVLELLKDEKRICVAGGGEIYEKFMPHANKLEITEVDLSPEGDTYFPFWNKEEWTTIKSEVLPALGQRPKLTFCTLIRKKQ